MLWYRITLPTIACSRLLRLEPLRMLYHHGGLMVADAGRYAASYV